METILHCILYFLIGMACSQGGSVMGTYDATHKKCYYAWVLLIGFVGCLVLIIVNSPYMVHLTVIMLCTTHSHFRGWKLQKIKEEVTVRNKI